MVAPTIKLNSGHPVSSVLLVMGREACADEQKMPLVGFGLWKVNNDTCADTVYNAIKTGYRLFDGACGRSCNRMHLSELTF
jgi:D-xylose reductase